MEFSKKFDQLLKLFNCTIVSGRAEFAPGLKTAKGADDHNAASYTEMQPLPHQLPPAEMDKRHVTAIADVERYGEMDQTPQGELRDPVPHLVRLPSMSSPLVCVRDSERPGSWGGA